MIRYRFHGKAKLAMTISLVICLVALVIRFFYGLGVAEPSISLSSFIGWLAIIWIILSIVIYVILCIKESVANKK